ncbi:MAG: glycosyltransferase family 4 protein [Flavobacteriales bacterium]|nr:glycosyltransferase family 4 protein [Flavobacteriales bacterium]
MKILQICSKPPLPSIDGGCKATHNFTKGFLEENIEVKILTLNTKKHPFIKNQLPEDYIKKTDIESIFVDTSVKIVPALINFCQSKSYNISRFYSNEFEELILNNLKRGDFDVVLFEGLYVSPYIGVVKKNSSAKLVYRAHNVEYEIWQRNAEKKKNIIKKIYFKILAKQLKQYEVAVFKNFDFIAAITERDKQEIQKYITHIPIEVFPFGIDLQDYSIKEVINENKVFYIGSMDWLPNLRGIEWFIKEVWSTIVKTNNKPFFVLAGKKMPLWLMELKHKNINVIGEVDNALEFISNNNIMVVPLFSGSGMRVKIIEAMALQKTVIGTAIAFEGISCENKKNVLVANNKDEFVRLLEDCFNDKGMVDLISKNARLLIEENYDNKQIVRELIRFIKSN